MARRKTRAAPYEVLRKSIEERNAQRLDIPQSMQGYMGDIVSAAYQEGLESFKSRHPDVSPTLEEFFSPDSPYRREAAEIRRQVAAQPANLDYAVILQFKMNGAGPEGWKYVNQIKGDFSQMNPQASAAMREARTIRDVQEVLWRANISGLDVMATGAYTKGNQDVAATIQNLDIGLMESIPFFNSKTSGSFSKFGLANAYKTQKRYSDVEQTFREESGSSIEAMTQNTGDLYGASAVPYAGGMIRPPLDPFRNTNIKLRALSESTFDLLNQRYQSTVADWGGNRTAQRLFGTLGQQDLYDLADHVEAGGNLTVLGENTGMMYQGSFIPTPERAVSKVIDPWFQRLAKKMDPDFGRVPQASLTKYPSNMYASPEAAAGGIFTVGAEGNLVPRYIPSFTQEPGFVQVGISSQDVVDFGRAKALGGLSETGFPVKGFNRELKDIRSSLSTTDHSVVASYSPADLLNDYVSAQQAELTPTTIPYFRMQARYLPQGGPTKETLWIKGQQITRFINRPVSVNDARNYQTTYNAQNVQKTDSDNVPDMNAGTMFEPKPYKPYIDDVDHLADLSSAQSFADDQETYNKIISRLGQVGNTVPELVAGEIVKGNLRPRLQDIVPMSENNLSLGLKNAIEGTVVNRNSGLANVMRSLYGLNPELSRQATYVGSDPDAFAAQVDMIAKHYDVNIAYKFGQTGAFELDYFALAGTHPKAAAEIARLFPSQFDQEKTAKALLFVAQKDAEERRRVASLNDDLRSTREEYNPMRNADARFPMNAARTRGGGDPEFDNVAFGGDFIYDSSDRRSHALPSVRPVAPPNTNPGGPNQPPPNYHPHTAPVPYRLIDNSTQAGRQDRLEGTMDVAGLSQQWQGILAMQQPRGGVYPTMYDQMVGMYSSPIYGQGRVTYDPVTGDANRQIVNTRTGEQVFGNQEIELARNAIENTTHKALGAPMPLDPADAMATIKQRLYSGLKDEVDGIVKNMEKATGDRLGSQEWGKKFNDLATELATNTFRTAENIVGTANTQQSGFLPAQGVADEIKKNAVRIKGADEIQRVMQSNPEVAQAIRDIGLTPHALASLPAGQEMILSGNGGSYMFGGIGGGFGGGGFGGSFSRGFSRVGQIAYGAYMMNQLWKMGTGGIMAETAQYGNLLSGVGSLALNGSDVPIAATAAGFSARQNYVNEYVGRTNYQNFGGFMDIPYYMSGGGDAAGRMYSSARMAAGIGMAGLAAPSLIAGLTFATTGAAPVAGSALAGLAGAAPVVGAVVGGALLAGTAGMEIYNAANPDKAPLTWGEIPKRIVQDSTQSAVKDRMFQQWKADNPEKYQQMITAENAKYGGAQDERTRAQVTGMLESKVKEQVTSGFSNEKIMGQMSTRELAMSGMADYGPQVDKFMKIASDIGQFTGETQEQIVGSMKSMQRRTGSMPDNMVQLATAMQRAGRTSLQGVSEADQYAQGFGYEAGSAEYAKAMNDYWLTPGVTEADRDRMMKQSQRQSGLIGQISGFFSDVQSGARIVQKTGMTNNIQAGNAQKLLSAWSGVYGAPDEGRGQFLSDIGMRNTPYVSGVIADFMQNAGIVGMNSGAAGYGASMLSGMSTTQAQYMTAAMGGDLKGISYMSQKLGIAGNAFFDRAGRQSIETSGLAALGTYNNWSGITGMDKLSMGAFLGTNNQSIIDAFSNGGTRGLESMSRDISYQASAASSGVALRGIALTEAYNWGSGTWNAPSAGSSWGIEDRMRAMSNTSTLADFGMQQRRMDATSSYTNQRETIQANQMSLSQNYSMWQLNQGYASALQQRGWTQQDWQYQDTTRQLNFNWGMEDINDAIRFSSGRQRKQLLRQKDRMVTSENLESDQIDDTRERQKQLWNQEDERYKKNKEYQTEMAKIERQNYDLNKKQRLEFEGMDKEDFERKKKEYKENFEIQTEAQTLQRKYQYDQLQLQKESAGISAWAAQKQKELDDALRTSTQKWEELTGTVGMINQYDKAGPLLKSLQDVLTKAGASKNDTFYALIDLFNAAGKLSAGGIKKAEQILAGYGE